MTKVLVIEDQSFVRANILELLEAEDFEVLGAENGLLGVLAAQQQQPDLIICDVMMPELDGYQVLEALQLDPSTAKIPFIFLTAVADKGAIRQGMELGADDYLTKPFTREDLLGAIAARLARQTAMLEEYNLERQRVKALEQRVQELQRVVADQEQLYEQLQQRVQGVLPKLTVAAHILKKVDWENQSDRYLSLLQVACAEEVKLLEEIPQLQVLLTPQQQEVLQILNPINKGIPTNHGH